MKKIVNTRPPEQTPVAFLADPVGIVNCVFYTMRLNIPLSASRRFIYLPLGKPIFPRLPYNQVLRHPRELKICLPAQYFPKF